MSARHCRQEDLIDFLDGGLAEHAAAKVREHLAECPACRDRVESLKQVFRFAAEDVVPEQAEAYWANFTSDVRARLRSRQPSGGSLKERFSAMLRPIAWGSPTVWKHLIAWRRSTAWGPLIPGGAGRWRLALVISPAVAVAVALVFALMQARGPGHLADWITPQIDQMTIGEIAVSISDDALLDDMLIEAAREELSSIEEYILETEGVNQLIESLADDEMEELATMLEGLMKQKGTHILRRDSLGRLS